MKIEKTLPEIDIEKMKLFFEERTGEELSIKALSKFDDKVEITSPGKLMPSVDFNLMEAGQSESKKSYTPESAEKMSEKMSEKTRVKTREKTREKILSVLTATPYITMNELAEIVGISKKRCGMANGKTQRRRQNKTHRSRQRRNMRIVKGEMELWVT